VVPPGLPLAESDADFAPVSVGANATATVHEAAGASEPPLHPFAPIANCDASVPPSAIETTPVAAPPMFVTVNVTGVVDVPVTALPYGLDPG
jgi:hypothetical protein